MEELPGCGVGRALHLTVWTVSEAFKATAFEVKSLATETPATLPGVSLLPLGVAGTPLGICAHDHSLCPVNVGWVLGSPSPAGQSGHSKLFLYKVLP